MKSIGSLAILLVLFLLMPSCRKPTNDQALAAKDSFGHDAINTGANDNTTLDEDMFTDEPYDSPGMSYYSDYPSIERVLGQPWDNPNESKKTILDFACVVQIGATGESAVKEIVAGHIPSDIRDYIPIGAVSGRYLICSTIPWGGWQLDPKHGRPIFVAWLRADDSFSYGYDDELTSNLENLREKCVYTN